jgi:dethiobiotin synthetase
MDKLLIAAVGTGIGKTLVTSILCHQLTQLGRAAIAIKPVVSGFRADDQDSDPALILRSLGKTPSRQAIAEIAPWRFAASVSPHLAARSERGGPSLPEVNAFCRECERGKGDILLIEGAGGIMTPLGEDYTVLDLAASLGHPVALVTGSYLGAISHTLTALSVIRARGLPVRGVIVSESMESAGLAQVVEAIEVFAPAHPQLYALSRLSGPENEKWRAAPPLTGLCELAPK